MTNLNQSTEDILQKMTADSALKELDRMIGLTNVKEEVHNIAENIRVELELQDRGLLWTRFTTPNIVFIGDDFTGKQSVAKILSSLLYGLGVTRKSDLTSLTPGDLVRSYMGQTAQNVHDLLKSGKGGTIFIDNASDMRSSAQGMEALSEINLFRNEPDTCIILSGSPEDMDKMVDPDSDFIRIQFDGCTVDNLLEATESVLTDHGCTLTDDAIEEFRESLSPGFDEEDIRGLGNYHLAERIAESAARIPGENAVREGRDLNSLTDEELRTIDGSALSTAFSRILRGNN